jgi:hypothetical protein
MKKKLVAVRLKQETVELLRYTSKEAGLSQAEVVTRALLLYTQGQRIAPVEDLF